MMSRFSSMILVAVCTSVAVIIAIAFVHSYTFNNLDITNSNALVNVEATITDTNRHPIQGASIHIYDTDHHILEGPDLVAYYSDDNGRVSQAIPLAYAYYVEADAPGYISAETKINVSSDIAKVDLTLMRKPPPPYPVTTISAKVVDAKGIPIDGADLYIYDQSGQELYDPDVSPILLSDNRGHIQKTVPTRGVYTIEVSAPEYSSTKIKLISKPRFIPVTIVLKRVAGI